MKQVKLWLATIAVLLCSLTASAHDFSVGGIYYNISSSTNLTVAVTYRGGSYSQYSNEYTGAVTIPATVTYNSKTYSVTSIGGLAFSDCTSLTSITLPESVTSIGSSAFSGCSLTSITLPEGVTSIESCAFEGCSSLTAITIPEGVTSIGWCAFYGCSSLTSITLPESVTSIVSAAFEGTAWYNNQPDGVVYAGKVLYKYKGTMPSNTSIEVKDGTVSISPSAFSGCSLTSITLPESVTSIGQEAFRACSILTSITIPESVTSIESAAFYGTAWYNNQPDGVVYAGKVLYEYKGTMPSNTSIEVKDGTVSISPFAFYNLSSLTSITLPEGVTSIGDRAFYGCSLTSITIPEGVTSIGNSAFSGYSSLYSVTIGSGVLSIGNDAFSTPEKVIWLTNTPPTGYANAQGSINYVANDLYTSLSNVKVYPYLSSMFEVDGVKYVPVSPSERTCHAIDCAYDDAVATINVGETASFKGVAMKVTEVMPYTFYGNDHIKEVSVSHLGNIGDYAFYDCDAIEIVDVSNQGDIGKQAFLNCGGIKAVKVSNNGNIGGQSFYNCDAIETVDVSNQGNIGYQTFYNCDGIKSVTASNSGDIGEQAFYNCDAIETVTISNQGDIGSQAFYDCDGIKSVDIRNQGNIGSQAFYGCNGMQVANIANIASAASFVDDTPLTFADWTSTNKTHSSTSSETYTFTAGEGATLSFNWSVSSEASYDKLIVTLDGTTILGKSGSLSGTYSNVISKGSHTLVVKYTKDSSGSSGSDQAKVSNITVSKGGATTLVAGVGSEAFSGCTALKTVTLGDSIGSLGDMAFYQCRSLQGIVIPDSVKTVGAYCFSDCSAMKSAVIGNGLTDIKEYTFADCGLEEILIGDNITSIGDYAFKGCTGMKHAVLGNGLTIVNGTMFSGCIGLEKVEMGNKIRTLAANAFSGCSALKDVALGSSVATINDYAFQNCSSLPEITLPRAVTKVGDYVFSGCSKLADVMIADRTTPLALGSNGSSPLFADCPLDSVYIGGKITYSTTSSYGYSPFYRNTSLRTVVITDREEQIYENEFYGCTNLQNVTIGNGVKSIGDYAFSGCSSLEGFSFGSNMESIGDEAFSDCTALTSITSHAAVPPTCGTQALDDINKWNCILKVPTGYMAAYQTADQWKEFFFIEDIVEVATYTLTFMVDGEVYHTVELPCEAAVTMPASPTKEGHTFSGWDKTLSTMPAEDVTISGTFTINKYLVTFKVDGEIVYSESLEYGASIVAPDAPEKEGHTFNGWGEVDTTVPAHDVTYEANYSVNSYQLTYVVDGETVQTESVAYGTAITLIDEPVKEGYTFCGWGEVPETMPAHDVTLNGTFNVNKYLVTFKVDGEIVYSESLEYGASIVAPDAPEKEGHTFNGWGEVDTTVPAHDVTYEANYSVNSYQLTYVVDGETVQTESVTYGTAITLIDEPVKEGYTFSGWGEVPETMPAHDVTLNGTFIVNKYLVTFTVDGAVIASDSLEYGTAITVPTMPEREGYTFSGWSEVAETVPAHNVTYDANYTANTYKVYYFVGATLVHTAEVAYGEAIPEYVYEPTAEGDVFMGWIGETYETMPAHDVTYTANITNDVLQLTNDNIQLTIYDLSGRKVTDTENLKGGIYIVNGKKVVIK